MNAISVKWQVFRGDKWQKWRLADDKDIRQNSTENAIIYVKIGKNARSGPKNSRSRSKYWSETISDCVNGFPAYELIKLLIELAQKCLLVALMPKKGQKCSIGALNVPVVDRDIALRPFLTADSVSPPQNWSSVRWTVNSKNFDMILRFLVYSCRNVWTESLWFLQEFVPF